MTADPQAVLGGMGDCSQTVNSINYRNRVCVATVNKLMASTMRAVATLAKFDVNESRGYGKRNRDEKMGRATKAAAGR